ncbi:pentatricopeptide repeat-containing protein At4g31850, chloroplastic-like [Phoenix dactylifera]|uniref:Pentatricopeptide repeat-containing protein At4g31850, chloroplastic-like n=1 Tax=Phoenix dactylifera TaxID=42345 RepID=A0A8B8ZYI1_PHODC|nr:pentatricopeptide repeat-containing protein At4g31850, chloroplastic-like [Phoenix dactylifera]
MSFKYNNLQHSAGLSLQKWGSGSALDILYGMTEKDCMPDLLSYNTVIYGLATEDRVNEALWLFHQMRKVCIPDFVTLCSILPSSLKMDRQKCFANHQRIYYAARMLREIGSPGKALMEGILGEAGYDQSVKFSELIATSGAYQNDYLLCPLIKFLCKHKKAVDAHKLFEKFKSYGISPTMEAYNLLSLDS